MNCTNSIADLYTPDSYVCSLSSEHEGLHDDGEGHTWEPDPLTPTEPQEES